MHGLLNNTPKQSALDRMNWKGHFSLVSRQKLRQALQLLDLNSFDITYYSISGWKKHIMKKNINTKSQNKTL